jgi:hypothetical protein
MGRPPTTFSDTELRGILEAASTAEAHAPQRNDAFLDHFIAGVASVTGRLYGQPVYVRLLGAAGIARRPSAPTWSAAIARARSRPLPSPLPLTDDASPSERQSRLAPLDVRELATGLRPSVGQPAPTQNAEIADLKVRVQVAEATMLDAYRKNAELDAERKDLLQRVAMAEAETRVAERRLQEVVAEKDAIAGALTARVEALMAAETRLAGLERHLRLQTDQLRTELSQQANEYKDRLQAAEKALERERNQADALRRVLGNRGSSSASTSV